MMNVHVAEACGSHTEIDLVSGHSDYFQSQVHKEFFFNISPIKVADAVLVPHDAYYFQHYKEYVDYIINLSKRKLVIYSDRGDFPINLSIPNSIALRVAINPGERLKGKIIVPYNIASLQNIPFRSYELEPTISFMGYIPKISPKRILNALRQSPYHPVTGNGAMVRNILEIKSKYLDKNINFISRTDYGVDKTNIALMHKRRIEYLHQIQTSDFILTPRGDANQSARFYEVLSAGRIPVIPNSYIKLPSLAPNRVDMRGMSLLVPVIRGSLTREILYFWRTIKDDQKYFQLQTYIRKLYIEQFEYVGFFRKFFNLSVKELRDLANL